MQINDLLHQHFFQPENVLQSVSKERMEYKAMQDAMIPIVTILLAITVVLCGTSALFTQKDWEKAVEEEEG